MSKPYYIYRHRRLDDNSIFYVGLGSEKNFRRSRVTKNRSDWWKNIVAKAGYSIEIIYSDLTKEDACELEEFLIQEYGRADLGLGRLVNMTAGGEGSSGRKITQETLDKTLVTRLKNLPPTTKEVINILTKEIYRSISFAAKMNGIKSSWNLCDKLTGKVKNDTPLKLLKEYTGEEVYEKIELVGTRKKVYNVSTKEIYPSAREAARELNIVYETLRKKLSGESKNDTDLIFYENYSEGYEHKVEKLMKTGKVRVLDTATNIIYDSIKLASESPNYHKSKQHLVSMLNGRKTNNTTFLTIE